MSEKEFVVQQTLDPDRDLAAGDLKPISNPATVYAPPVPPGNLIIESREDVVSEGNETEITCTAMGSKPASSIMWMKGDQILQGQIHTPTALFLRRA